MVKGRAKRAGKVLGHKRGIAQERMGLEKRTKSKTRARNTRVMRAGGVKGKLQGGRTQPMPSDQGGRALKPQRGAGRLRGTV